MSTANPYLTPPEPLSPSDEKLWATLVHVGGIFFGFLPALVAYLLLRDRGSFIREHTAAALNFQLTALIASVVATLLVLVVIGIIALIAIAVLIVVFSIIAAMAAYRGERYTYPLSIPFVR